MKIVVNHLTRMKPGFICVAGIETASGSHIRPVIHRTRLSTELLLRNGGPFDIATEVELGRVTNVGTTPEIEDRNFDSSNASVIRKRLPKDEFWALLQTQATDSLRGVFGNDLQKCGRTAAIPLNLGKASLGCVALASTPELRIAAYGGKEKIEIVLEDPDLGELVVSVTELRFHRYPDYNLRKDVLDYYADQLTKNAPVILSVGLSRKFRKPSDTLYRHWLQVNNIHLEDKANQQDATLNF